MSVTAVTNSFTNQNNPTTENGSSIKATGAWSDSYLGYRTQYKFYSDAGTESVNYAYSTGTSWNKTWSSIASDTTFYAYAWAKWDYDSSEGTGSTIYTKTNAMAAAFGTPEVGTVTSTTAQIRGTFNPRTHESTCTVVLLYKKTSDPSWTTATSLYTQSGFHASPMLAIPTGGGYTTITGLTPSTSYDVCVYLERTTNNSTTGQSTVVSFTTSAAAPTTTTNDATSVTNSSATLNATTDPNLTASNQYFEYGLTTSYGSTSPSVATWTSSDDGNKTPTYSLTGLTSGTTYHFRSKVTYGASTVYGSDKSFATTAPPAYPDITTDAASDLGITTVTLNGTVNPNGNSTGYEFRYQTSANHASDPWGSSTTTTTSAQGPSTATTPFAYEQAVTGLTAATAYTYQAQADYGANSYYGSDATFTTDSNPADPGDGEGEDQMQTMFIDARQGQDKTICFTLRPFAATSNNLFYTGAVPDKATDVFLFRNGAWISDSISTAITQDTASGCDALYVLTLKSAEISTAELVDIIIHDAAGNAFRDLHIQVRTIQYLQDLTLAGDLNVGDDIVVTDDLNIGGLMNVDEDLDIGGSLDIETNIAVTGDLTVGGAATITGILSAASITGVLTSMILNTGAVSSISGSGPYYTVLGSGSTTGDLYNGAILAIVAGTGAGQCRTIIDYATTSKTATIDSAWATDPTGGTYVVLPGQNAWNIAPTAELSAMPTYATGYGALLQFLFQRFAYKRLQNASSQVLYKADSATALATGSFSDSTTEQTIGKLA